MSCKKNEPPACCTCADWQMVRTKFTPIEKEA